MTPPLTPANLDEIRFRTFVLKWLARQEAKMERLTRHVRAYLPLLGRGRPRHKNVTRAAKIYQKEGEWNMNVYRAGLHPALVYDSNARRSLRNAVKLRKVRELRKVRAGQSLDAK